MLTWPSPGDLLAGILFSAIGYVAFSQGRRQGNSLKIWLGVALMGYSYLVSGPWLTWGIGLVLTVLYWRSRSL